MNFLLPRALESRGAGNAQERRWWRRKRLSIRGSGAVAASGSTAGRPAATVGQMRRSLMAIVPESGTEEMR